MTGTSGPAPSFLRSSRISSASSGPSLLAPRGNFVLSWVGYQRGPLLLFSIGLTTAGASSSTRSSRSLICRNDARRSRPLRDRGTLTIFLGLERGDSDLGYLPLCNVAGSCSPLVGMTHPLVYNGTVIDGIVERLTGRVGGRIQIDQEEDEARIGSSGYMNDMGLCAPVVRML